MSRAIVTHFDGDPYTLNAWLTLYKKNIQGECDKVYMSIYYDPKAVPESVIDYERTMLADYPEIVSIIKGEHRPPETGNQDTLKMVTEDYVGLIESDGFVYGRGIVDQCFRLLENEGQDIVAPRWFLIDEAYFKGELQSSGFMRCFCFVKRSLLTQIEIDFNPRTIPKGTVLHGKYTLQHDVPTDCFGWVSWQLLLLTNKITYVPSNILGPDNILSPQSNYKWVHVRQMSSSAIGCGGGEYKIWANGGSLNNIFHLFDENFPDGPAEYIYIKAVAFKLLFFDMMMCKGPIQELLGFADEYKQMLEFVIAYLNLPVEKVYEIKGYYKSLFEV